MNLLEAMGLPSQFGIMLLVFCFVLTIAPALAGKDFGFMKIPKFEESAKRRLRRWAPVLLLGAALLHLPIFSPRSSASADSEGQDLRAQGNNGGADGAEEPREREGQIKGSEQTESEGPRVSFGPPPIHEEKNSSASRGDSTRKSTSETRRDEPSVVVHYADPGLAELAAEIARLLSDKHEAAVRVEGPPSAETGPGDCHVRILFSYKDATRRYQAEKYWSTVAARWQGTSRRPADDTLVSDFEFSLQCLR